ncbi:N-acetyltransferase, partial [Stenotrophomonas lactitubi]
MATRNRMPPWHEIFKAPSGHELLIRPIRPEDGAPLQAAFSLFGPEEIRDRFLQSVTELSPETTQRLTHPNPKTEITLVAAESLPAGEAVVGAVARASIIPGTREAEYAILISRFLIGQG